MVRRRGRALGVVLASMLVSWPGSGRASDGRERLEGLTIDVINVEAAPQEDATQLEVLSGLQLGSPFRAADMRRAVKLLYQLGRFENVYVFGRRVGNVVQLRLKLVPRARVREVTLLDSTVLDLDEVTAALGLSPGSELDIETFSGRRRAVTAALTQRGYRDPAVGLAVRNRDENGGAEVVVRISEGPVTRLADVEIVGDPRAPKWRLTELLNVDRGDVLDLSQVRAGLERIRADYRRRGFQAVQISDPEVIRDRGGEERRADLRLTVHAGPRVDVRYVGNTIIPIRELDAATRELRLTDAPQTVLDEVKDRLQSMYEQRGHYQARLRAAIRTSADGRRKEVVFGIEQGPKGRVTKVSFPGNEALDEDLLRQRIQQLVTQSLLSGLVSARPDPAEIDDVVGNGSLPRPPGEVVPHPAEPDPEHLYVASAYDAASDAIADLFRAEGFQTVQVERPRLEISRKGRALHVSFPIRQGVRWRVGAMSISGSASVSPHELLEASEVKPGEPLSFYKVDEATRAIRALYRDRGFLFARVDEEFRQVLPRGSLTVGGLVSSSTVAPLNVLEICAKAQANDAEDCPVELVFRIREGAQVKARRVVVRGNDTTRQRLVDEEITIREGEVLRESDMEATQRNLSRLGVFQRVRVRPMDEEREDTSKDVLVELHERKHSSFEVGAGISTEEGVRAFAGYGHGNLLGTALRFQANAKVNYQTFRFLFDPAIENFLGDKPLEFVVSGGFQYPRVFGLPRGFSVGLDATVLRDNDPSFRESTRKVALTAAYKGWQPVIAGRPRPLAILLRTSVDLSEVVCNTAADPLRAGRLSEICQRTTALDTDYVGVLPGISFDLRDDRLEPTAGLYFELQPELLIGLNAASPDHLLFKTKINGYIPLGGRTVLAASLLFWRIFRVGDGNREIPPNRRIFAGGRSTIRGFQERTLFPYRVGGDAAVVRGEDAVSPGGEVFAALKTELRFPLATGLSGAIFHDFGDLYDNPGQFSFTGLGRQSVGAGMRYSTPIGPLLVDLAVALPTGQTEKAAFVPHFAAVGSF